MIVVVGLVGDGCGLSWVDRGGDGSLKFVSLTDSISSRVASVLIWRLEVRVCGWYVIHEYGDIYVEQLACVEMRTNSV